MDVSAPLFQATYWGKVYSEHWLNENERNLPAGHFEDITFV